VAAPAAGLERLLCAQPLLGGGEPLLLDRVAQSLLVDPRPFGR
jgi:hypothetical protein